MFWYAYYHSGQNFLSSRLLHKGLKIRINVTINNLTVVLYGCESWSVTLREEHRRLRVLENRVLRRIFGPKGDEIMGGWRKSHNEEFHNCTFRQV
jgi:hypothetical protein